MSNFFCYDPNGNGMQFFDTPGEAKRACEKAFDLEQDAASEGWNENISDISWGEVLGKVEEKSRRELSKQDAESVGYDTHIEYQLEDETK